MIIQSLYQGFMLFVCFLQCIVFLYIDCVCFMNFMLKIVCWNMFMNLSFILHVICMFYLKCLYIYHIFVYIINVRRTCRYSVCMCPRCKGVVLSKYIYIYIRLIVDWFFRRCIYIYIYVWKLNQTVLELDFRAVKFLFFPRRDLNPHHWYTAAPFA